MGDESKNQFKKILILVLFFLAFLFTRRNFLLKFSLIPCCPIKQSSKIIAQLPELEGAALWIDQSIPINLCK